MLRNICLEISLKPFKDLSDAGIRGICEDVFRQWRVLIDRAQIVSLLFWSADGSEILDYRGSLNDQFEWAKYIGTANGETLRGSVDPNLPEEQISIHHLPRLYMNSPVDFTYGDLKRIVAIAKTTFSSDGRKVRVGTTFDPGPEFAKSDFKYLRHPEILDGGVPSMGKCFVGCCTVLNEDKISYAGFPNGIEQGTTMGTFLGRQSRLFCADIGFDYIWFSNGFGFGSEPWWICGSVFDGRTFCGDNCDEIKRRTLSFWSDFRRECPELPVENRGTNLSAAMDLASDAVPLRDIYREVPGIYPQPNPPCASLRNGDDGDYGIELVCWMSHIAELPEGKGYPYRFYIHDPWWLNSPWLDRYGRNPHDIYLPLSVIRLDVEGRTVAPDSISFLSVDDSHGNMPEQVPNEIIPHLHTAMDTSPDEPGPFIWLYPFDEYHDRTYANCGIDEVFFGDWFVRNAINTGFPLNTVVSTANFVANPESSLSTGNIIVAPAIVAENSTIMSLLEGFLRNGGSVIFYGPASVGLQALLQLEACSPLSGELQLTVDGITMDILHNEIYSAGGIVEKAVGSETQVLASVGNGKESRDYAVSREFGGGGQALWLRGSNSFIIPDNGSYPQMLDKGRYFFPEELMRILLEKRSWTFRFDKYDPLQATPVVTIKKHANARYLAAYVSNLNTTEYLGFPEGAPVFTEMETVVSGNIAKYSLPKASHLECRVFVEMPEGAVKVKEFISLAPGIKRRLMLSGLKNATVRFRPEPGFESETKALLDPGGLPFITGNFLQPERTSWFGGTVLEYKNVTGRLLFSW